MSNGKKKGRGILEHRMADFFFIISSRPGRYDDIVGLIYIILCANIFNFCVGKGWDKL